MQASSGGNIMTKSVTLFACKGCQENHPNAPIWVDWGEEIIEIEGTFEYVFDLVEQWHSGLLLMKKHIDDAAALTAGKEPET